MKDPPFSKGKNNEISIGTLRYFLKIITPEQLGQFQPHLAQSILG